MFCARCGQQIAEGTQVCPYCGQPPVIAWKSVAAEPAPAAPTYDSAASYAVSAPGPRGVQGWLLFFCVFMTILQPAWLLSFFGLARLPERYFFRALFIRPEFLLGLLRVLFGIVTGALVWAEHRSAMAFVRIYYAWGVGIMLISLLSWAQVYFRSHETRSAVTLTSSAGPLASLVAGILYFSLSQRVRNTLGSNLFG